MAAGAAAATAAAAAARLPASTVNRLLCSAAAVSFVGSAKHGKTAQAKFLNMENIPLHLVDLD